MSQGCQVGVRAVKKCKRLENCMKIHLSTSIYYIKEKLAKIALAQWTLHRMQP